MAKLKKDGLLSKIKKLKELDKKSVEYGIFGAKASQQVSNGKISVGHLAHIHEEGRSYVHPGGTIPIKQKQSGEIRWFNIKPGTVITIPARPFFTNSRAELYLILPKIIKRQFKLLMMNKNSVDNMFKQIGETCKRVVQDNIKDGGNFDSLSNFPTIWAKGHSRELQDSMKLYNAVNYKVWKSKRK